MLNKITAIQGHVLDNRKALLEVALSYSAHIHPGICAAGPLITTPTPMALSIVSTIAQQFSKIPEDVMGSVNVGNLRENYLNPNFPEFIKSKNVNTT